MSDLLVISYHGGTEYVTEPDPTKAAFFRELASAGADIVFGHHPHVLQPVEVVRADGEDRLIIHSAGNFISAMTYRLAPHAAGAPRANTGDTALIQVELLASVTGHHLLEVKLVPISTYHTEAQQFVLGNLHWLARRGPTWVWTPFYVQRRQEMTAFFDTFSTGLVRAATQ